MSDREEDFRTVIVDNKFYAPVQLFRGRAIDRCGFVVWDGKLKRPYEVLRDERHGYSTATTAGWSRQT